LKIRVVAPPEWVMTKCANILLGWKCLLETNNILANSTKMHAAFKTCKTLSSKGPILHIWNWWRGVLSWAVPALLWQSWKYDRFPVSTTLHLTVNFYFFIFKNEIIAILKLKLRLCTPFNPRIVSYNVIQELCPDGASIVKHEKGVLTNAAACTVKLFYGRN